MGLLPGQARRKSPWPRAERVPRRRNSDRALAVFIGLFLDASSRATRYPTCPDGETGISWNRRARDRDRAEI